MKDSEEDREPKEQDAEDAIFEKCGVKVTDMSERGVKGIGFLGGVSKRDQRGECKRIEPECRRWMTRVETVNASGYPCLRKATACDRSMALLPSGCFLVSKRRRSWWALPLVLHIP